jgi:hypothetical protein
VGAKKRARGQNRSKFPEQAHTIAVPENPFSIFNEGPGKPSLRKSYLFQRREAFICLIEPLWHEFGWELKCARTDEQVRQAFHKMAEKVNPGPLAIILRSTSEVATKASIETTRTMLAQVVEKQRSIADAHQVQLRAYQDSARVAFLLSEDFKKQLGNDLMKRKQNARAIKIHISEQKGKIRRAQLQQERDKSELELDLPTLARELQQFEDDLAADENVCRQLEERIASIKGKGHKVVADETFRRKEALDSLEQELKTADLAYRELETKLLNQEAFFFRSQILEFKKDGDYAFTPRNLASALAGLPYITSRRSAELCSGLKSNIALSGNYELLAFIGSVWNRRAKRTNLSLIGWFKKQIRQLPKSKIIEREKRQNDLRTSLAERWFFLMRALERLQGSKLHPRAMPYAITKEFLRQSLNPETPADSILAEINKIMD